MRVDVTFVVGDVLQGPPERAGGCVVAALGPRARRQGGHRPLLEPGDARGPERRQDDLDELIVLAVVVGRDRLEHPVGELHRVGSGLEGDGAEIAAGPAEHVADVAPTVVDAVQDRLGQPQEPPQQLERQIGAGLGHLLHDQLPLQVEVLHEGAPLLPVDEGPGLPQRGEPLADIGGNGLGPGLGAELEPQPALDPGVPGAELEQDLGQPLGAEGFEVVEVKGLLRRHRAALPVSFPRQPNGRLRKI
jgi:hypothetical protein